MREQAPQHISLPPRLLTVSGGQDGLITPSPQTPMPHVAISTSSKRDREEDEVPETTWLTEELEVVQAILRHPFQPLSTPFPPGELPPPATLDELTNQILAYALRSSSDATRDGWGHGWDATRKQVYIAALEASRSAHGVEKMSRAERASRPGLRRVDSMDFLDQAEENTGSAIRSSTSLQNSAKPQPIPSALPAPRRRLSQRASLARAARPASLLQRGRSYTANELQAEGSASPQTAPPPVETSSIIASKPLPHAARDMFLHSKPVLEPSIALDVLSSSPTNWSDSDDDEARPKRRANNKSSIQKHSREPKSNSLQSPFDEKASFL